MAKNINTASSAPKPAKAPKARRVALTQAEYARLEQLQQACKAAGMKVRKTELIRVAIALLGSAAPAALDAARAALAPAR